MRDKSFAVSTPWSIEFYEDLFIAVEDFLLESFSNKNFNMTCGLCWWFSWFQESLNISSFYSFNEWRKILSSDWITVKEILFTCLSQVKNYWDIIGIDSQIFSKSIKESMTIVFIRLSEDDSLWVGLVIGDECLLGRPWLITCSGE